MTDQQQSQQDSAQQLQQTTMNQGQEAIEQLIDLQRNVARMALSAMQWQDTAQRQGLEMTQSMLQGFPGQQFTETMIESYLEGLEAMMPEMERAMEKGMQVAARPGMEMGQQMERAGQQMERASHGMDRQGSTGGMQSGGRTGGQWSRQAGGSMQSYGTERSTSGQQMGGRQTGGQQTGHSSREMQGGSQQLNTRQTGGQPQQTGDRSPRGTPQQYQTGEWVSPERTYGGEPSGTMGERRPQEALAGDRSGGHARPQHRSEYETQSRGGRSQTGTQSQGGQFGSDTQRTQRGRQDQRGHRGQQDQFGGEMRSQRAQFSSQEQPRGERIGRESRQARGQPTQSRGRDQSGRPTTRQSGRSSPQHEEGMHAGPTQHGRREAQREHGREFDQSGRHRQSDEMQTRGGQRGQQNQPRDRYSQRIDTEQSTGDRGRQRHSVGQGGRGRRESAPDAYDTAESRDYESSDVDAERDYDTDELPESDMELSAERGEDEREAETDTDADLESEDFEGGGSE